MLEIVGALFLVWLALVALFTPRIDYRFSTRLTCDSPKFLSTLQLVCQTTLYHNNCIEILTNAPQFYPAMLAAIRGAQHSINLECFIFRPGAISQQFVAALSERAAAGITVRVVVDAVGCSQSWDLVRGLRRAGCWVKWYRPLTWYGLARYNNRTHRELLIVDGQTAIFGGAGISDVWSIGRGKIGAWRDTMVRVTGPLVAALQGVFAENWRECSGETLTGDGYFPELGRAGTSSALVLKHSSSDRAAAPRVAFQMLIEGAEKSIRLTTPFFLPDRSLRLALTQAAKRGVRVEVILPGWTDRKLVKWSSRRSYGSLLRAGVHIYEYQASRLHAKTLIVDNRLAIVGSTNIDNRSFEHNDEADLLTSDEVIARRLTLDFAVDRLDSKPISLNRWKRRSVIERFLGPIAKLFERQQ